MIIKKNGLKTFDLTEVWIRSLTRIVSRAQCLKITKNVSFELVLLDNVNTEFWRKNSKVFLGRLDFFYNFQNTMKIYA